MHAKSGKHGDGRPPAAERAALEALAARGGSLGRRARIALALVAGEPPSRIRLLLGAAYATIRSVRARYAEGGAEALAARKPANPPERGAGADKALRLRPGLPAILLERAAAGRRRGRTPAARLSVETWARDAVALGFVPPGGAFPTMRGVRDAFHTSLPIVRDAFASLARQGFVKSVPRCGTVAAVPPPFAGRYLFVESESHGGDRIGYRAAVREAARHIAASRGVRFEFANGDDILERRSPERVSLLAAIREHRWAGVFIREWTERMELAGDVRLDAVPVCVPYLVGHLPRSIAGSHVSKPVTPSPDSLLERLVEDCAEAGCRRLAVVDHRYFHGDGFREPEVAALARRHGLELGPWHYQELALTGDTPGGRGVVLATLKAMLAPGRAWNPDCVVLMDDHWIDPLEEALAPSGCGRALRPPAATPFVACIGNRPALPATRIPVRFRGYDLEATLVSFLDWCDAIHAGAASPPPPVFTTF